MVWTTIPDTDIDADSPLTTALLTAFRDNIILSVPCGSVIAHMDDTVPDGYLECNGASLSTTTYSDLHGIIGYKYGGSGSSFNIPDLRGEFLRGWDHTSGIDPDRASRTNRGDGTTGDVIGSKQNYQMQNHNHSGNYSYGTGTGGAWGSGISSSAYANPISGYVVSQGGNETRPRNVYTMYCIRYRNS